MQLKPLKFTVKKNLKNVKKRNEIAQKYAIIFFIMFTCYEKRPNRKIIQIKNNYFPKLI